MSLPMSAANRIQIQTPQLILNLAFEKAGRRGRSPILDRPWCRKGTIRLEWS
jgi:hypothetical protein